MAQEFAVCACVAGAWGKEEGAEVVVAGRGGEAGSCYYLILFSFLHPGISAMCRLFPGRLGWP